jgi:DNA-binding transcriptional LysR family regulator
MVEAGLGWGDLPLSRVAPLLASGRLVRLNFAIPATNCSCRYILWRKQQPLQQAARLLIEQLADQ